MKAKKTPNIWPIYHRIGNHKFLILKKEKMNKRKAIFGFLLCTGMLFCASPISKNTTAQAGYALAKWAGSGDVVQNGAAGAGGAAGGLAASWAGAKIGGKVGAVVGGPVGIVVGAGLGAM